MCAFEIARACIMRGRLLNELSAKLGSFNNSSVRGFECIMSIECCCCCC